MQKKAINCANTITCTENRQAVLTDFLNHICCTSVYEEVGENSLKLPLPFIAPTFSG